MLSLSKDYLAWNLQNFIGKSMVFLSFFIHIFSYLILFVYIKNLH